MKRLLNADTRPRSASGVRSCASVFRITTLTLSAAPAVASAASESGNQRERPKTMVATPKSTTARSSAGPARRNGGRWASTIVVITAPTDWAASSHPRPAGPTCRMSLAHTGRSATAPPNSTAKRSRVIAAMRMRVRKT